MNQCADATLRTADQTLNRRYQTALQNARDEEGRAKLRAAQRAWIPYRDAHCAWEADAARGGSLAPLLVLSCLEAMTGVRALEISRDMERMDPGLWAGGALARLREHAPAAALRGVYWLPEAIVSADFDQDGRYDLAAAGLNPPDVAGKGGKVHVLVLLAGTVTPLHATAEIGGDGLCAAPIETRVEYPPSASPRLTVDDGACDAFRFYTTGKPRRLAYERN
jgi:uncharacterized protein YecT (DUF1311 family)